MFVGVLVIIFGPLGVLWGAAVDGSLVAFGLVGIMLGVALGLYINQVRLPYNQVAATTGFMIAPLAFILALVAVVVWGIRLVLSR
jgi:hypothetical protein